MCYKENGFVPGLFCSLHAGNVELTAEGDLKRIQAMRMREHRLTMKDSLSTAMEVDNREHLVRLIFDRFGKRGIAISDEMIHVSHYGFDDRIDWDDHIIVVDGQGVFGFTDAPCPRVRIEVGAGKKSAVAIFGDEVSQAYGVEA